MTLTEFLLARIAEDETVARKADEYTTPFYAIWGGTDAHICDDDGVHVGLPPARVLAECEAKRRAIDAAWGDLERIESEWGSGKSRKRLSADNDNPAVIEWLATPYADHPDYDEAWRP